MCKESLKLQLQRFPAEEEKKSPDENAEVEIRPKVKAVSVKANPLEGSYKKELARLLKAKQTLEEHSRTQLLEIAQHRAELEALLKVVRSLTIDVCMCVSHKCDRASRVSQVGSRVSDLDASKNNYIGSG